MKIKQKPLQEVTSIDMMGRWGRGRRGSFVSWKQKFLNIFIINVMSLMFFRMTEKTYYL